MVCVSKIKNGNLSKPTKLTNFIILTNFRKKLGGGTLLWMEKISILFNNNY